MMGAIKIEIPVGSPADSRIDRDFNQVHANILQLRMKPVPDIYCMFLAELPVH